MNRNPLKRVLVVGRRADDRLLLSTILREKGWDVTEARSRNGRGSTSWTGAGST